MSAIWWFIEEQLPGSYKRSSGAMYGGVPLMVDCTYADSSMRLLMPKSLSFTHHFLLGGCDLIRMFWRQFQWAVGSNIQRRGTYPGLHVAVGEAFVMHKAQAIQYLINHLLCIGLRHGAITAHVFLQIAQGEVFHSDV